MATITIVFNDASQISNTPAGDIEATNVQDAINELDTEKAATGDARFPTTDEKAALVGTGTPSGGNVYVTADTLTAKQHTLADITDSGTAAAWNVGTGVNDVVQMISDGGAKLPAVDGSNLTGIPSGGNAIEVEDDTGGVLTTAVTKFLFAGDGVVATEPVDDEITVTVAGGAAPINTVFGEVGDIVEADANFTAVDIANQPAGDIAAVTVQGAIDELDGDKAAVGHTQAYTTVDGVPTDTFLGRDTAGTGATEAMNLTVARNLLNVQDGSVAAGTSGDAYATNHESDSTAHDATEIVNQPAGDIAAVTVQAAIDELDGDKSATGHEHLLIDVTDSGTAAALPFGTTIGDLVQLVNEGGNAALPVVDGSLLTGIDTSGNDITVQDEADPPLTTALTKLTFTGIGVEATMPGAADEIIVNVTSGAPGVIDITDGVTTVSAADKLTFDGTAFDVTDEDNDDALVEPIFGAGPGQLSEGDHTHDTLANVSEFVIIGRDTAGPGLSEELTPTEARTLIDVALGNLGPGVHSNLEEASVDSGTIFASLQTGQVSSALTGVAAASGQFVPIEIATGAWRRVDMADLLSAPEANNLETVMTDALQHEVPVGTSGGDAAVYRPLSNGAVSYDTGTETFDQAALADLSDGATAAVTSEGAGAPSSTPASEGDVYTDTTADVSYIAAGTASSADWKQATGGGDGDVSATGTPLVTEYARWTDATTIEGRTKAQTQADLDVETGVDFDPVGTDNSATHTGDVIGGTDLTIDVLKVATGMIQADAVTYAKMQNVVTDNRLLGTNSGAGTIVEELDGTEVTAMLDVATTSLPGLGPARTGGASTDYLSADGTYSVPPGGSAASLSKGVTVADPASSETIDLWVTPVAITITEISYFARGTTQSVAFDVSHGTDPDTLAVIDSTGWTASSTTIVNDSTFSGGDVTVTADSVVAVELGTVSGTDVFFHITVHYTED
jgi:hypothetical protein